MSASASAQTLASDSQQHAAQQQPPPPPRSQQTATVSVLCLELAQLACVGFSAESALHEMQVLHIWTCGAFTCRGRPCRKFQLP